MDEPQQPRNSILQKLKPVDLEKILRSMELSEYDIKEIVYEPNQPIDFTYFPESGVISIVTPLEDGSAVEAATIGNEGMVGLPLLLQARSSPTRALWQVPGKAWLMPANEFRRHMAENPHFSLLMHRYAQTVFDLIAQTSACNRLHTIEQRCARWLLLVHDRMKESGDSFPLTQEFLSQMLGVRRSGVNLAAGLLQKAKLITYVRGKVTVLDRQGLEHVSCECYRVVLRALETLDSDE